MRGVSEKLGRHVKTDGALFIWREPKPERGEGVERRDRRATLASNIFEISAKLQFPHPATVHQFVLDFAWADSKKARKNHELDGFTDEWVDQAAGGFAFFSASYPSDENAESIETNFIDRNHWVEKTITDDEKARMDEEIKRRDPELHDFIQKLGEKVSDDGKVQIHQEIKRKVLPLRDYLDFYMFLFVCVLLDRPTILAPFPVKWRMNYEKEELLKMLDLADEKALRQKSPQIAYNVVTWAADHLASNPFFFEKYFNEVKSKGEGKGSGSFRTFFRKRIWQEMEKIISREIPLSSDDEDPDEDPDSEKPQKK